MKISKAKLRQIIKEELGALREQDPAEENYVKLVNTLGDIFQHHLEEVGMQRAEILRAVEEATEIELAGNDEEGPEISDFLDSRLTPNQWAMRNGFPEHSDPTYTAIRDAWQARFNRQMGRSDK